MTVPRSLPLLCLLTLAALLTACDSGPGDNVIRDALNAELEQAHLDELLEVEDVEQLSAVEDSQGDYSVEVNYRLRARKGLADYAGEIRGDDEREPMDRFAMTMALAAVRVEFGPFEEGDTFNRERRLVFSKGDQGWQMKSALGAKPDQR